MYKQMHPEDGMVYQNVVVTIRDGKLVNVKKLDPVYSADSAINDATSWLDTHYDD